MEEVKEERLEISISDLFDVVKRFWYLLLITAVLFGALGVFITSLQTPKYSSSANFYITTSGEGINIEKDITVSGAITPFVSDYVVSSSVLDMLNRNYIIEKYPDMTVDKLKGYVFSSIDEFAKSESLAINYNRQFKLTVTTENPELCKDVLDAYVRMFADEDLELADLNDFDIKCSSGASIGKQVSPSLIKNIAISILIGVFAVYMILFVLRVTHTRIVTSEDVTKRFQRFPILAVIPHVSSSDEGRKDVGYGRKE